MVEMQTKRKELRKKIEKVMLHKEPKWARIDEEEEEVPNYGFEEEEEERDVRRKENELYCVACRKKFKSEKQWENHEQSKKDCEKVAKLKVSFNGNDECEGRVVEDVL